MSACLVNNKVTRTMRTGRSTFKEWRPLNDEEGADASGPSRKFFRLALQKASSLSIYGAPPGMMPLLVLKDKVCRTQSHKRVLISQRKKDKVLSS